MMSEKERIEMIDDAIKEKFLWALDTFNRALTESRSTISGDRDISIQECLNNCASGLDKVANSITASASGDRDESGTFVTSLTESVMGVTAGLVKIAEAIETLADAVADSNRNK